MNYIYLHGFASSPDSTKARFFKRRFSERGLDLQVPDLAPDFRSMTITSQIDIVRRAARAEPVTLIGSSLGGYVAALCAGAGVPVERLVLLAPAFGFSARWAESLGGDRAEQWRTSGSLEFFHYAAGEPRHLSYTFVSDATGYRAYPAVTPPVLLLHGRNDKVVPVAASEEFCRSNPGAQLVTFDSGHELTDVIEALWEQSERFLGLPGLPACY